MSKWRSILSGLSTFPLLISQTVLTKPLPIGFRILSYEGELLNETELNTPPSGSNVKSLSREVFSSLRVHADWDQVNKEYRFIAGKPWMWCYHIYDRAHHWHQLGINWKSRNYILNINKSLGGMEQTLIAGELIEWLPCLDFKVEFE